MRRVAVRAAVVAAVAALVWYFDFDLLHFLGWDGQTSDNYAAWSGSVPALFTLVGLSTIVTGLWTHVNCHEPGCVRIGKHKVDGTPWCTVHHENARPETTDSQRLDRIIELLERRENPLMVVEGDRPPRPATPAEVQAHDAVKAHDAAWRPGMDVT